MTTVRMPVRVCLEVAEDRLDDGLVDLVTDAVDAALARAVDTAKTVRAVSDSRWRPSVWSEFSFTGDPLPDRVAGALEQALRTSVELAAARLDQRPAATDDGAPVPAQRSSQGEVRDDDRVLTDASGADAYQVPYYDQNGNKVSMRLQGLPQHDVRRTAPDTRPPSQRLRRFGTAQELWSAVMTRFRGAVPDQVVAIHRQWTQDVAVAEFFVSDRPGHFRLTGTCPLGAWSYPGGRQEARLDSVGFVAADRWSFYGQATGNAQVRELLVQAMVVELLRDQAGVGADEIRKQAEARVKQLPTRNKQRMFLYQLTSHGEPVWIGDADPGLPRGPLDVVVLTEDDPDPREDTYGKCPPLDEPFSWLNAIGLLHDSPVAPSGPFLGEPAIANWPPRISERLRRKVDAIADQLHMTPGPFAGGFLIGAMAHIDRSCRNLVRNRAPLGPQLQNMAAVFGAVRELENEYAIFMLSQDDRRELPCPVAGQSQEWVDRFHSVLKSARNDAVASMFVSTCQEVLLGVLVASGKELHNRAVNFDWYMSITRVLMTAMLADVPELMELREALNAKARERALYGSMFGGPVTGPIAAVAWQDLTGSLIDSLTPERDTAPGFGTVKRHRDGERVYDGKGRWWSRSELETLLSTQRQQVMHVDPLIDKLSEVDEIVRKLRAARILDARTSTAAGQVLTDSVDKIFNDLLNELLEENRRWQRKAWNDRNLGFGLANFSRDDGKSEIGAKLTGIHKLADERLKPTFTDERAYLDGMARLAEVEIGKEELSEILNLVGMTVLAIFCAPLALAVGVVQAAEGLHTAFEHRDLQRAMLDADEILSKAQVEAEMWAAVISAALTVLPEVPALARGVARVGTAAVREEVTDVAVAATRQAMRNITQQLTKLSLEHFTERFGKELIQNYLIDLAMKKAMNRIADSVAQQVAITGEVSFGDVFQVGSRALQGREAP